MSHATMRRAQWVYESKAPEDAPYVDCELCDGKGSRIVLDEDNRPVRQLCEACEGEGVLDSVTGAPWDAHQNERDLESRFAEQRYWRDS